MLIFLSGLLFLSLGLNAYLLSQKKKPVPTSYEASALLRDLLSGEALVKISRIAPEDIFLRSPRDSK